MAWRKFGPRYRDKRGELVTIHLCVFGEWRIVREHSVCSATAYGPMFRDLKQAIAVLNKKAARLGWELVE